MMAIASCVKTKDVMCEGLPEKGSRYYTLDELQDLGLVLCEYHVVNKSSDAVKPPKFYLIENPYWERVDGTKICSSFYALRIVLVKDDKWGVYEIWHNEKKISNYKMNSSGWLEDFMIKDTLNILYVENKCLSWRLMEEKRDSCANIIKSWEIVPRWRKHD